MAKKELKILALDLGTKTGWAISPTQDKDRVYSGVQDFSLKRGESPGMRFLRFDRWLYMFIAENDPDIIVYEMPHHRGGAATAVLGGLVGILLKACAETNTEHTTIHSMTLKKYATGSGKASKEEMIKKASIYFNKQVQDNNEADALLIWAWAQREAI